MKCFQLANNSDSFHENGRIPIIQDIFLKSFVKYMLRPATLFLLLFYLCRDISDKLGNIVWRVKQTNTPGAGPRIPYVIFMLQQSQIGSKISDLAQILYEIREPLKCRNVRIHATTDPIFARLCLDASPPEYFAFFFGIILQVTHKYTSGGII